VKLLVLVAVALLAGCAAPGARIQMGGVSAAQMNCADLFASAMATPGQVNGTWACLSPNVQAQFRAIGLDGDPGVAQLASKDPLFTKEQFMGRLTDGGYVYSLSGKAGASVLIVWLDQQGHVVDLQTGGRQHP
jgi:hypothetical protein